MEKNVIYISPEIKEIIPVYIERRKKDLMVMHEALSKNDLEIIKKLGHKIKGTGSLYNLDKISAIGKELEIAAKNNKPEHIKKIIEEFSDFLNNLEIKIVTNDENKPK
ncbi:MAG: hypothetical protein A2539_02800 [Elusimicrobia bacterium RIFOXYD2_FULL_34_15]|nr:MAG: hypothetical protein A2539_02800 [Elusimicrobia bacterium RIFOXYD2_FULL_34_15]